MQNLDMKNNAIENLKLLKQDISTFCVCQRIKMANSVITINLDK